MLQYEELGDGPVSSRESIIERIAKMLADLRFRDDSWMRPCSRDC